MGNISEIIIEARPRWLGCKHRGSCSNWTPKERKTETEVERRYTKNNTEENSMWHLPNREKVKQEHKHV